MPSRLRRRKGAAPRAGGGTVVFAHSAFWRQAPGAADEGEEGYIGKVVRELKAYESNNGAEARPLRMIGLGPRTNFRARKWWHPLRRQLLDAHDLPLTPIEEFASWRALSGSRQMWRDRLAIERALLGSTALRDRAHVLDYGIWPIVAAELRGVARLQFPWSARAMDEAAAALDACRPRLIVTYAEAGGWGRALMLEARRRGIASAGLQHGFIYRHWLNYLHAEDEMMPSPGNRHDRGFPRPDLTLLYDDTAADHLRQHGHFPAQSLRVTGSPALDALAAAVAHVTDADRARVREQLGAAAGDRLVLVVSKFTQIGAAIPALAAAIANLPGVRLVIKPHPAETADPYVAATSSAANTANAARVTIAPPALDLASLVASARLLVTVNSTVAIDAMTLGVPALAVLLPNNLTPFVEAGAMAGMAASDGAEGLAQTLAELTGDDIRHAALAARARAFAESHGIRADGQAAARAVEALAALYNG
jgi:UDP-N-acetylglucosamine 2-epimerase